MALKEDKIKKAFSFKLKKDIDERLVEFANMQSNLTDTLIYLMEKEIAENGVRNLQEHIPPVRNILGGTLPMKQEQKSKKASEQEEVKIKREEDNNGTLTKDNKVSNEVIIPSEYE